MKYIEVTFTMGETGMFRDLLVDTLGNEGPYDSFVETSDGLKAYVPTHLFDEKWLRKQQQELREQFPTFSFEFSIQEMEDKDWNAEWEKGHEAVLVCYDKIRLEAGGPREGTIWVRAPFHPHRTDVDYELIIEPKMSFGTAHHPTTYMMLSYVAELDMQGKRVIDMGCGTAILAILAKMRGASYVEGIDIDEWAYRNALENAATNGVEIDLKLGDASLLVDSGECVVDSCRGQVQPTTHSTLPSFDIIIANINRNILLADMDKYAAVLKGGGVLLLSGFYEADIPALVDKANALGLTLQSKKNRDGWAALELRVKS